MIKTRENSGMNEFSSFLFRLKPRATAGRLLIIAYHVDPLSWEIEAVSIMLYFSGILSFRIVNDEVMTFVLKKVVCKLDFSYLQYSYGRYIQYLYFRGQNTIINSFNMCKT